jgi:hypothetical protein
MSLALANFFLILKSRNSIILLVIYFMYVHVGIEWERGSFSHFRNLQGTQ